MSLTFTGGNTDNLSIGANAALQGLTSVTFALWAKPSALAGARYLFGSRYEAGGVSATGCQMNNTSGHIRMSMIGGVNHNYVANNLGLTVGVWSFVAGVMVFGTSGNIYIGSLTSLAVETTYSTQQNGSVRGAETGGNFLIGNRNASSAVGTINSFAGDVAWFQFYNRALTLGEVQSLQFSPRLVLSGCVDFHIPGIVAAASSQPDWSGNGNAGTVTGATEIANAPISLLFPARTGQPYVVAAAPGGGLVIPVAMHQYAMLRAR